MYKVNFFSDVHFEINGWVPALENKLKDGGNLLVMGGDILCARHLRKEASDAESRGMKKMVTEKLFPILRSYDSVVHIMGNHEYYGFSIEDTEDTIRDFYQRRGIRNVKVTSYLEEEIKVGDDTKKAVFTTLWSNSTRNPAQAWIIERSMNDYRIIEYEYRTLRAEDTTRFHEEMRLKLFAFRPDMVFSHHAPSFRSETRYKGSDLSPAYCSELDASILVAEQAGYPISYWVHGHTHCPITYQIGDHCKVRNAMLGYCRYDVGSDKLSFNPGEIVL